MTDLHAAVSAMDALRSHLVGVIDGTQQFDLSYVEGLGAVALIAVLRSLPPPYAARRLQPLFLHLLEHDEATYVEAVSAVFPRAGFSRADNALHFLEVLSGPGFVALQNRGDSFRLMHLLEEWVKAQVPEPQRLVFVDEIPDGERDLLHERGLLVPTCTEGVERFRAAEFGDYLRALRDSPDERFPRAAWLASDVIPDDVLPKAISLLARWFSPACSETGAVRGGRDAERVDRHVALSLVKRLYHLFRGRYARDGRQDDLERLHHLVWFVLAFLGDDADHGVFRPYAEVDQANADLLVDYLLLNPRDHLSLFLMHNRDAQYSSLSRYGIRFDGVEHGGGLMSGSGLTRTLDEVPLAEHLLQPALARLLQQHRQTGTLPAFWRMLRQDWLRPDQTVSSLCPVVLRRSCVPAMVALASETKGRVMRDVFRALEFLVHEGAGIPDTSMKVFSELRNQESLFAGPRRRHVRRLVLQDMEESLTGTPRCGFAFECLLKLVAVGDKDATAACTRLLANRGFYRRDSHEFDIVANIARLCGADSPMMREAVGAYLATPEWQTNASNYTKDAVQQYLATHGDSAPRDAAQALASGMPDLVRGAKAQLVQLAESDFPQFAAALRQQQAALPLASAFPDRGFIVDAVEAVLTQAAKEEMPESGAPRVVATIDLLAQLVDDPCPPPGDESDRRVLAGEKIDGIVGIRTRTCYAVAQLACLRPFLIEAWGLARKLLRDPSAYVRYFAFVPFFQVLRRRSWNESVRREAVATLWNFFADGALPAPLRARVLTAFMYVRDLSETEAERVLTAFADQQDVEALYIFYGVFREDHVPTMGPFDSGRFARLLELAIDNGPGDLPLRILRTLWQAIREEPEHAERLLPYVLRYSQPQHAVEGIVDTGMMIVEYLLKRKATVQIGHVRTMLLNLTRLEVQILKAAQHGSRAFWLHSLGGDALRALYSHDRDGFYEYLDLLCEAIALGKAGWHADDLGAILAGETDPAMRERISAFYDRLVACDPGYFPMRQAWLDGSR